MQLELNTNGAWRVVLRHLEGAALRDAMDAAATLARLSDEGRARSSGIAWRQVSGAEGAFMTRHRARTFCPHG
jgi:hypothetical protein